MKIYRVTVEYPYSDEVKMSHLFRTQTAAKKHARGLKRELKGDDEYEGYEIVVACYMPDNNNEICFDHCIQTYDL